MTFKTFAVGIIKPASLLPPVTIGDQAARTKTRALLTEFNKAVLKQVKIFANANNLDSEVEFDKTSFMIGGFSLSCTDKFKDALAALQHPQIGSINEDKIVQVIHPVP